MKKIDLKISLFLASICFIAGFFVIPYQFETLQTLMPKKYDEMIKTIPLPMAGLLIVSSLQFFIVSLVLSFTGIKLARKTGFSLKILDALFNGSKIIIDRKSAIWSIVSGTILGFVLMGYDKFYYQYQNTMIAELQPEFSFLGLMAGMLYGGFFEEIMLRLFLMSLIVWIFMKIFKFT